MKKPYLLLLALAFVLTGLFVSCSDDDDNPQPDHNALIQGRWQYEYGLDTLFNAQHEVVSADTVDTDGQDNIYFDFQENGQFSTNLGNDTTVGSYRFVNASTLELTVDGVSDQAPVQTLTAQQLTFVLVDTDYGNGNYSRTYYYFSK
ncbi:hypothetical protein [Chitinophaga japonensis]|uniref:Lipocalin-like protein n=1 Tax=Chitinophaga japonensis TaxID=104662 RepID=A0A562TE26_CHIJA|nr:hypothetical protein [Chitinophaga japonensis]TWI91779.1 hypothetical protein LX66_1159 [Chitinophaga japonensis]